MPGSGSHGNASGQLSTDDGLLSPRPAPLTAADVGDSAITGRMQAIINCHNCNLKQIEQAVQDNLHEVDPHPIREGEYLFRHPVILACWDDSQRDRDGTPAEGAPAELNMQLIREVFSTRYPHVSADPPPHDGSHIDVDGMHVIAELDHAGNPTGRVRLGNPEDVE